MIAVIIPYYQQKPGLLGRALASVFDQDISATPQIYVVDDSSPCPPDVDLDELSSVQRNSITVLRQRNAGPGAARNRALDSITDKDTIVAFLDSDDAWHPSHLSNVQAAFSSGAQFYFADHQRDEEASSQFCLSAFVPDGAPLPQRKSGTLRWCDACNVARAIVVRSPIGTSTVALSRALIGSERFLNGLRSAGEDSLFWLSLLKSCPRVACGLGLEAHYGRGVSVFNHRSWGDSRAMRTTLDEMCAQLHMRALFRDDIELCAHIQAQCRRLDQSFCASLLACLRRRQWDGVGLALPYLQRRPQALLQLPHVTARALRQTTQTSAAPSPTQPAFRAKSNSFRDRAQIPRERPAPTIVDSQ